MRIRIRIYMEKEPELYMLYKASGPALTRKIFRRSVESYILGQPFNIDIPKITLVDPPRLVPNPMFDFTVDNQCDKALAALPARSLTAFVKALVRFYAFQALIDAFGIPHAEIKTPVLETSAPTIKKEPSKIVTPSFEPKPVEKAESASASETIDNSDINSLAALFGSIKTR
ncbi:hypothetical protein [Butyrivibrio sp.]|uniref:hypothetical protein n=1 Tax=Butyrivibrio sp. TaxID=28121 RepID=UPI0025C52DDD|nr:hypothetical protein [Butyrivibrio sp.]MBQ7430241.1 hypothetical protein [Butyrivibrio sp.]MBQ9303415.1 hypothetical protein [Butyrivibrio sp.]